VERTRIRRAEERDAPAIARLHLGSYRAAYQGLVPSGFLAGLDIGERERRWRRSLADPERTTFVIERVLERVQGDTALDGLAEIGPCRDGDVGSETGELMALHITRLRWGRGAGRALHGKAMETLAARGCARATLWVLAGNSRARAFYEAVGWRPEGRTRSHLVNGVEVSEVRYVIEPGMCGTSVDGPSAPSP
jgi:RimJ/RimL family protein N-acetyltransferase